MSDIIYQVADLSNYKEVNNFYNSQYSSKRPLKYWSWAYDENPMGNGRLFMALSDSKIVGIQGVITYVLSNNRRTIQSYKSEDTLVDQNFRGRGVFSELYKLVHEYVGSKYLWGFTDKHYIFNKVSMSSSNRLSIYYKVCRSWPLSILGKGIFKKRNLLLASIWLKQFLKESSKNISKLDVHIINSVSEEDVEFISNNISAFYGIKITRETVNWRLNNNPILEAYLILRGKNKEVLTDIAFISINKNEAKLLSWYYKDHQNIEERSSFMHEVFHLLKKEKATTLSAWALDNNTEAQQLELYQKVGLHTKRRGLHLVENNKFDDSRRLQFSALHSLT